MWRPCSLRNFCIELQKLRTEKWIITSKARFMNSTVDVHSAFWQKRSF